MAEPIWICAERKAPASDTDMEEMRAALRAKWDELGGGEYIETVRTAYQIGCDGEVMRIDWRTA